MHARAISFYEQQTPQDSCQRLHRPCVWTSRMGQLRVEVLSKVTGRFVKVDELKRFARTRPRKPSRIKAVDHSRSWTGSERGHDKHDDG